MHQSPLYILLYIKYYNFKNNIKSKTGIIKHGHKRVYLFIYFYRYTFIYLFYILLFIEY